MDEGRAVVGRHTYAIPDVETFRHDDTKLEIGNYTSIAAKVTFLLGGNHPLDRATTFPLREKLLLSGAGTDGFPSSKGSIVVGSDVWIGYGSLIVSGVSIGHGAVVAAGSVVVNDVPPYAIVGGCPARIIKYRLDPDLARRFIDVAWWDWPEGDVVRAASILADKSPDHAIKYLEQYGRGDTNE